MCNSLCGEKLPLDKHFYFRKLKISVVKNNSKIIPIILCLKSVKMCISFCYICFRLIFGLKNVRDYFFGTMGLLQSLKNNPSVVLVFKGII